MVKICFLNSSFEKEVRRIDLHKFNVFSISIALFSKRERFFSNVKI